MKKDISQLQFGSISGWRGDSLVCPQAFGGDIFAGCSMNCWWCFCREMEQGLYNKYYTGWSRDLVRPCNPNDFEILFQKAFESGKDYSDWSIKCLRQGLPFNMGSKSEIFCVEDFDHNVVEKVLKLFLRYKVPMIIETKSHFIGLKKYLDILLEMKDRLAVVVSIMGGTDTLNYVLEPNAPPPSMRWALVERLNSLGIWTAVRWEPILVGINSSDEIFESYLKDAVKSKAKHVSLFNYRTSNYKLAQVEFEKRGFNYGKLLTNNLDENWAPVGKRFFRMAKRLGVPCSSPDFVNFPFDSDRESCCGVDGVLEYNKFTFMRACRIIKEKGVVRWSDMESVDFIEPEAYKRMKDIWNSKNTGGYYSMLDSPEIALVGSENGMNIYGRKGEEIGKEVPKKGLLF